MYKLIKLRGKEYPIRISYYAIKQVQIHHNVDVVSDIRNIQSNFQALETLLFAALVKGAKVAGTELDLKREDMEDILDEHFNTVLSAVPAAFYIDDPEQKEPESKPLEEGREVEQPKV